MIKLECFFARHRYKFTAQYILILVLIFTTWLPALSGGPLEVRKGKALSYGKRPVIYRYDKGKLGKLTNEEAISLAESLFNIFE